MPALTIFLVLLVRDLVFKLTFLDLEGGIVSCHIDICYDPYHITLH